MSLAFGTQAIDTLAGRLQGLLRTFGYSNAPAAAIAADILSLISMDDGAQALRSLGAYLERAGIRAHWNQSLEQQRAPFLGELVAPHLEGSILDLLSGNGLLAQALSQRIGAPVVTVERQGCDGAPRFPRADHDFAPFAAVPPCRSYDTVLLCTVLHHERDPASTLALAARVARRRIVIVENCIDPDCPEAYQQLVDLIFNESLNKTSLPCPSSHRTLNGWLEAAAAYGKARHVGSAPSAPGVPLSHDVISIRLSP